MPSSGSRQAIRSCSRYRDREGFRSQVGLRTASARSFFCPIIVGHDMDITAVARRAGVSTATVSRVLNDSTKVRPATAARVRDVIKELQYVPNTSARHLRVGRTNLYGLLVSDIRNPFFPDLIEQFESLAVQHGIDVTIANTWYSEDRLLAGVRRLLERNVDGIAVLTSESAKRLCRRFVNSVRQRSFSISTRCPATFAISQSITCADFAMLSSISACSAIRRLVLSPVRHRSVPQFAAEKHSKQP